MDVLFGEMSGIGQRVVRLLGAPPWAAAGALVALASALRAWGFTVDDALIPVRYALHLRAGLGWRFNALGPSTDGVTPLPWPLVLAALGGAAPLSLLARAQALGLAAWVAAASALGAATGRTGAPRWVKASALAAVGLSVPVAAHAVSGLETPLATSLATAAVLLVDRPLALALVAGSTAALRPEMAAWAAALAFGSAVRGRRAAAEVVAAVSVALAPFALCAVVRALVWGRPAPLAVMAKPSDLAHGVAYALAGCVVTVTPILAAAPVALARAPRAAVIVAAAAVHAMAVAAVGGDWMPFARLMVPVAPGLAYAGVLAAEHARPLASAARCGLACVVGAAFVVRAGTEGRQVGGDRRALIASAAPLLRGHTVAALDVGWAGASTDATVIDLAGLTDPEIAALPGGHTSKRVDSIFLLNRDPDCLLLYALARPTAADLSDWFAAPYPRVVEARLAGDPVIARHFAPAAWLELGSTGAGYVLLRRSDRD